MRIYEVIQVQDREILDEGIKDTLKKIGLGALIGITLAGPAKALDGLSMTDLLNMGMSKEQASEIIKMPTPTASEVVQRYEVKADDPEVTKKYKELISDKAEKKADTTNKLDIEKVNDVMKKVSNDDPKIKSYEISGKDLIIYIDSKIEKGYEANLEVNKKLRDRGKDVKDPKDAFDYYGFNDAYKKSLSKMIPDIENINFKIVGSGK